jgi:hypothetical protein
MIGGAIGYLLQQQYADTDNASAIATTYELVADAMTAHYDGDHPGIAKAIDQIATDPHRATTACKLLVALLTNAPGVNAARLRHHASQTARPAGHGAGTPSAGTASAPSHDGGARR